MRALILAASLAALVAACSPPASRTQPAAESATPPAAVASASPAKGCARAASGAKRADGLTVEAAAIGADCDRAVAVLTVKDAAGEPIWTYSTHLDWLMFDAKETPKARTPEEVDAFLTGWISAESATTADLPDWPEDAQDLNAGEEAGAIATPLSRAEYLDLRARKVATICYTTGWESSECVAHLPDAGGVIKVFEFGS